MDSPTARPRLDIRSEAVLQSLSFSFDLGGNRFPYMRGETIDYVRSFELSIETPEALTLVSSLHETRKNVVAQMAEANKNLERLEKALNDYISPLFVMTWSLRGQAGIRIHHPLDFEWRGSVTAVDLTNRFPAFVYELSMSLHTLAITHVEKARFLLREDIEMNISLAGKSYLSAASILDYMAANLLPRWNDSESQGHRPPEVQIHVCFGLSRYYQAMAQKCAVIKAICSRQASNNSNSSTTSNAVLAKLSIGVANLSSKALVALGRVANNFQIVSTMLLEVNYTKELFLGLACYFEGLHQQEKEHYGNAVGLLRKSLIHLYPRQATQSLWTTPGLPPLVNEFVVVVPGIDTLYALAYHAHEESIRNNNNIFFQPVPSLEDLANAMSTTTTTGSSTTGGVSTASETAAMPVEAIIMKIPAFMDGRADDVVVVKFNHNDDFILPDSPLK